MPDITKTDMRNTGSAAVADTTLNGTDSFAYTPNRGALLVLRNPTAGALSPVIDGDGATTVGVVGVGSIDISAGYAVGSIAAGATKAVRLDAIREYLAGTIAVTSGSGLVASLLEF